MRRALQNWGLVSLTRVAGVATSFLFTIVAARKLGPFYYGQFVFVTAWLGYFAVLSEFGFTQVITQKIATDKRRTEDYLLNVLIIRSLFSVCAMIAVSTLIYWFADDVVRVYVLVASSWLLMNSFYNAFISVFHAHQRMLLSTIVELPYTAIYSAVGIAAVMLHANLLTLFLVLSIINGIRTLACAMLYRRTFGMHPIRFEVSMMKELITSAAPIAFWLLASTIELRVNVLVLNQHSGQVAVGLYGIPSRLLDVASIGAGSIAVTLLPIYSESWSLDRQRFTEWFGRTLRFALIGGIPVALGAMIGMRFAVEMLLGGTYLPAIPALQVMVWTGLILTLQFICGTALQSTGQWSRVPILGMLVAMTSSVASILLVSRWSITGASFALLIAEGVNLIATGFYMWRLNDAWFVHLRLGRFALVLLLWSPFVATSLYMSGWWFLVSISIYVILVFAFRLISKEEIALAVEWLPRRTYHLA